MAAQLHSVHPCDCLDEPPRVVRSPEVERHAEQVEPALAGGVAHRLECVRELGLDTCPYPHRRAGKREEQLERRACCDVDAGRGQLGWSVSDDHRTRTIAMRLSQCRVVTREHALALGAGADERHGHVELALHELDVAARGVR